MKTKKLSWDEIQNVEGSFFDNIQETVEKATSAIMESEVETIGLSPDTYYFYKEDVAHCATWSLCEGKLTLKNIEKVDLNEGSFRDQWNNKVETLVESFDENNVDANPMNIWESMLDMCKIAVSKKKKLRKEVRKPKVVSENKVAKTTKSLRKKSNILAESIEKVSSLIDDFFGVEKEVEYTFDISEGKVIKNNEPIKPLLRNIEEARQSAKKLNWTEYFDDKAKFLNVNEEAMLLTTNEINERFKEIASYSFDIDDHNIKDEIASLMEHRKTQEETIKGIFAPFIMVENKDIDTIILEGDQVFDTDQKNFMEQLTEILTEIFDAVEAESDDDDIREKAGRFKEKLANELISDEGVDKDILAELAKSAVELASTLEGMDDTSSIDKDELMNQPGADTDPMTKTVSGSEVKEGIDDLGSEEPEAGAGVMGDLGDYSDEFDAMDGEVEEEDEDWKELHCEQCQADFKVDMNKVNTMNANDADDDIEMNDKPQDDDAVADIGIVGEADLPDDASDLEPGELSTLDAVDVAVDSPNECPEVACPYCQAMVNVCDGDEDLIDQTFDSEEEDDLDDIEVEEGSPAADPNYFGESKDEDDEDEEEVDEGPAIEPSENPFMDKKKKVEEAKIDEQSPAADYEYVSDAIKNSKLSTLGNSGTKGKFALDAKAGATKSDDKGEGEEILNRRDGKAFKQLDNKSPKSDDDFVDGEKIIDKKGSGFVKGGSSKTKPQDKSPDEDGVVGKKGKAKFKKDKNTSPKSDDKFVDGETIVGKKGKAFVKDGNSNTKPTDKGEGEDVVKSKGGTKFSQKPSTKESTKLKEGKTMKRKYTKRKVSESKTTKRKRKTT